MSFEPPTDPPPNQEERWTNQLNFLEKTLLRSLWYNKKLSLPFRAPVNPIELNVPDYYGLIKNPMDLGTIKKRLMNGFYTSAAQCIRDFKIMFTNCYVYNPPDLEIVQMAKKLEAIMLKRLQEMPELEVQLPLPVRRGRVKKEPTSSSPIPIIVPESWRPQPKEEGRVSGSRARSQPIDLSFPPNSVSMNIPLENQYNGTANQEENDQRLTRNRVEALENPRMNMKVWSTRSNSRSPTINATTTGSGASIDSEDGIPPAKKRKCEEVAEGNSQILNMQVSAGASGSGATWEGIAFVRIDGIQDKDPKATAPPPPPTPKTLNDEMQHLFRDIHKLPQNKLISVIEKMLLSCSENSRYLEELKVYVSENRENEMRGDCTERCFTHGFGCFSQKN